MAKSVILITHDEGSADISEQIGVSDSSNRMLQIVKLQNWLNGLAGGAKKASLAVGTSAVQASGTITFSDTGAADDTVLINGVTFTAKASGATGNEWNVGASATLSAAALAAAINASVTALVSGYVTASADSGVVTITAVRPGTLGNCITIAEGVDAGADMAVSGARLTGGTEGTEKTFYFGSAV
jgi:phage tail sheath gpL-like